MACGGSRHKFCPHYAYHNLPLYSQAVCGSAVRGHTIYGGSQRRLKFHFDVLALIGGDKNLSSTYYSVYGIEATLLVTTGGSGVDRFHSSATG